LAAPLASTRGTLVGNHWSKQSVPKRRMLPFDKTTSLASLRSILKNNCKLSDFLNTMQCLTTECFKETQTVSKLLFNILFIAKAFLKFLITKYATNLKTILSVCFFLSRFRSDVKSCKARNFLTEIVFLWNYFNISRE